jgi:hypothetical protein
MKPEVQAILNGKNQNVNQVEPLLSEALMEMVTAVRNKEGEELAGIMNFHYMEITTLMRKAAAIGYSEADNQPHGDEHQAD